MGKSQQAQPSITQLLGQSEHISDIHFSDEPKEIIYHASHDGVGGLFRIAEYPHEKKKISAQHNVRGTVGYGGGSFDLTQQTIAFCDRNGAIFLLDSRTQAKTKQIVPGFLKTCAPKISPDRKWVLFIYEQQETNGIGISTTNGLTWSRQLVLGADFYMQPVWHPSNEMVAWVEWDHPYMPWDAARVKLGYLGGMQLRLLKAEYIDGKLSRSATQPQFSPDGKYLSYIKRNEEWDDLCLLDIGTKEHQVIVRGDQFNLRMPDWIQGLHSYRWSPDSQSIYFIKYHRGIASLAGIDIPSREPMTIDISPYVWLSQLDISSDGKLAAAIGSTATSGDEIVTFALDKNVSKPGNLEFISTPNSIPEEIRFSTGDGQTAYAWYYPARGVFTKEKQPPCIIKIHSGPTGLKHAGYAAETEFFQLHGFAVAHLNYRGSVSFGYSYQYALERKWGQVEVEDTLNLIDALESQGLVDKNHIAVLGSSAGGFSVLHLLIKYPGVFNAAVCSYAVSDLVDDAQNTHKFEKYYHRFLTGNFPEEKDRFIDRSPITHIDRIKDPVALIHGSNDPVVSVRQSELIYQKLQENGIPSLLTIFDGEGHGFRRIENMEVYYQTIINFLQSHI